MNEAEQKAYLIGYSDALREITCEMQQQASNFDSKHDSSMISACDSVCDIVESMMPVMALSMDIEEVEKASEKSWPSTDSAPGEFLHGINVWYTNFDRFARLLGAGTNTHWWISDTRLKYLNVRVDTRNNRFRVYTTNGSGETIEVDPQHVAGLILRNMRAWRK